MKFHSPSCGWWGHHRCWEDIDFPLIPAIIPPPENSLITNLASGDAVPAKILKELFSNLKKSFKMLIIVAEKPFLWNSPKMGD